MFDRWRPAGDVIRVDNPDPDGVIARVRRHRPRYSIGMDMEQVIKQLQDTATVMAGIQARQAEVLKGHGEWLEEHQASIARHEAFVARHEQMMALFDTKMIEIEDKLNGLIGYVDGNRKPE